MSNVSMIDGHIEEPKMTDEGIIKNLEKAIEIIKRQKAEIEILIRKKEALRDEIAEQQAEIERLKDAYIVYEETTGLKQAKAETIAEFKVRLISDIDDGELYDTVDDYQMTIEHINAVEKEMMNRWIKIR